MTVYADASFYQQEYLSGKAAVIPSASFPYYARKASGYIDQFTFGNIGEDVPESVRLCCCELAEAVYSYDKSPAAQGITSEKVGDISVSYSAEGERHKTLVETVKDVIYSWLSGTGLLYRGGSKC